MKTTQIYISQSSISIFFIPKKHNTLEKGKKTSKLSKTRDFLSPALIDPLSSHSCDAVLMSSSTSHDSTQKMKGS